MMIFKEIVYQILFFYTFEVTKRKEPMKLSQQSQSATESAIRKAIAKYVCNCEQTGRDNLIFNDDIHLRRTL